MDSDPPEKRQGTPTPASAGQDIARPARSYESEVHREAVAPDGPDTVQATPEELRQMGFRAPHESETGPGKALYPRITSTPRSTSRRGFGARPGKRFNLNLGGLKQLLDELKAKGEYPVSIRVRPKKKPR